LTLIKVAYLAALKFRSGAVVVDAARGDVISASKVPPSAPYEDHSGAEANPVNNAGESFDNVCIFRLFTGNASTSAALRFW
jgi:hypothetical protein